MFQPRFMVIRLFVGVLLAGCGAGEPDQDVGSATASVVYGEDDRREVFQHPSELMRTRALQSSLSLISLTNLVGQPDGSFELSAPTLEQAVGVCSDERFASQLTAARCSAVLVDDDLVLTAGHCLINEEQCQNIGFVFDYRVEQSGLLATINADDVYQCARLVVREQAPAFDNTPDFAIVQLDRPVAGGKVPAPIRLTAVASDEPLTMIGHGTGLPAKIDSGATVANPRETELDFFTANLDAFGGHSGSPVFDDAGDLVGILVAGREPDYVVPQGESCFRVNVFDDFQADEAVHYVGLAVDGLCDSGWQSDALCGECVGPDCPPAEWSCNVNWYGAGDQCDCACGAYDPDCDNKNLTIAGCSAFQTCDLTAKCKALDSTTLVGSCAVTHGSNRFPVWLVSLLGGLAVWRRRSLNPGAT